jgi:hypothetical protein
MTSDAKRALMGESVAVAPSFHHFDRDVGSAIAYNGRTSDYLRRWTLTDWLRSSMGISSLVIGEILKVCLILVGQHSSIHQECKTFYRRHQGLTTQGTDRPRPNKSRGWLYAHFPKRKTSQVQDLATIWQH